MGPGRGTSGDPHDDRRRTRKLATAAADQLTEKASTMSACLLHGSGKEREREKDSSEIMGLGVSHSGLRGRRSRGGSRGMRGGCCEPGKSKREGNAGRTQRGPQTRGRQANIVISSCERENREASARDRGNKSRTVGPKQSVSGFEGQASVSTSSSKNEREREREQRRARAKQTDKKGSFKREMPSS